MKFRIEEVSERPWARFDSEEPPRSWLLSFFLEEARLGVTDLLDEIEKAKSGEQIPSGFTGNGVDMEFYPDRAVIEELWPADGENAEPARIELPLEEARQLLLEWQSALERWRAQHI